MCLKLIDPKEAPLKWKDMQVCEKGDTQTIAQKQEYLKDKQSQYNNKSYAKTIQVNGSEVYFIGSH